MLIDSKVMTQNAGILSLYISVKFIASPFSIIKAVILILFQISTNSEDISKFNLFAPNHEAMQEAREIIKKLLESDTRLPEFKFGEVYEVEITEILDRGIFVQMHPEMKPAFINNSQLEARKVIFFGNFFLIYASVSGIAANDTTLSGIYFVSIKDILNKFRCC